MKPEGQVMSWTMLSSSCCWGAVEIRAGPDHERAGTSASTIFSTQSTMAANKLKEANAKIADYESGSTRRRTSGRSSRRQARMWTLLPRGKSQGEAEIENEKGIAPSANPPSGERRAAVSELWRPLVVTLTGDIAGQSSPRIITKDHARSFASALFGNWRGQEPEFGVRGVICRIRRSKQKRNKNGKGNEQNRCGGSMQALYERSECET